MCIWGMSSAGDSTPKLRRGGDAVWLSTRTGSPCHLLTGNMDTVLVSQPAQGAADTGLATRLRPSYQTPGGPTRQGQPTKISGFCWKDKVAGVGEGMNIWNNSGRQFISLHLPQFPMRVWLYQTFLLPRLEIASLWHPVDARCGHCGNQDSGCRAAWAVPTHSCP